MNEQVEEATSLKEKFHQDIEKAYQIGLLHGINAQSMATVERDVMAFEDYGWRTEESV